MTQGELTCVDLFSGAGGLSLGFLNAGFDIAVATDYHEDAGKTYRHNFDSPFIEADITNISKDINLLLESGDISSGDVDVIVGGPPCKGFSNAGVINIDDPRSSLLDHYLKVVEQLLPKAIIIENVPGAKTVANGTYISNLLKKARNLGYKIRMLELDAVNYGVPQFRERLFFIGYLDGSPISRPIETHVSKSGQQRLGRRTIEKKYVSVEEAISDLAFLRPGEKSTQYQLPPQSQFQKAMRSDHDGALHNHVAPDHGTLVRERFETMNEGSSMDELPPRLQTKKDAIFKYVPSEPANTVTTLPEDFVHYEQPRIPTVRELARIQTFPDWFKFKGPRTAGGPRRVSSLPQYSQVGNAVPPLLAEAVGRHVMATLMGEDPKEAAHRRIKRFERT